MKEKHYEINRKYEKEDTVRERLNRLRSDNRKLVKLNKILKGEIRTLERALRESIERIGELTEDTKLEVLFGTQEEETEDDQDILNT